MSSVQHLYCRAAALFALTWLLTVFVPQDAQADFIDCGDFWAEGTPTEATLGAFPCYEYDPADSSLIVGPGTDYRIFYTAVWDETPQPNAAQFLEAVAQGFDASIRHYQGLGLRVDPIYFMASESMAENPESYPFIEDDWSVDAEVVGDWQGADEPCPATSYIMAFESLRTEGVDAIKQLAAHEVFHCVQWFNFPTELPDSSENDWITEGSAEYFSHAVYTCANNEHVFSDSYDPDQAIVDQSYSNVVFFQHLAAVGGIGEDGILNIIRGQRGGSKSAQQNALARMSGMSDMFHEFGKDYIDDDVPDCGGVMPVSARAGEIIDIGDEGEVEISAEPFKIARYRVRLQKGKKYQITQEPGDGEGRLSWRNEDDPESWEPIPAEVEIPCDENDTYHIVATTAPDDDQDYELTVKFEADDEETSRCCVDTGEQDQCLLGTWRADDSAMEQWLRQIFAGMSGGGSSITLQRFEADAQYTADEMGGVRGTISNASAAGEMRQAGPGGREMVNQFTIEGGGQSMSRWSTEGNRTLHLCPRESNVVFTMTMTGEFGSFSMPIGPPTPESGEEVGLGYEFEYQCSGRNLSIIHRPAGLPPQNYRATKIGGGVRR